MKYELTFKECSISSFDCGDGKVWFTGEQVADLLGYADSKKVSNIYNRHKDEFTESMTTVLNLRTRNENNEIQNIKVRVYSLRGAHLLGALARTKVAKDLRIWLMDLIEKESGVDIGTLEKEEFKDLPGEQIHHKIAEFNRKSYEFRGKPGSQSMNQRRRDLKKIREATALALELTQIKICDLGDFPEDLEVPDHG